MTDRLRSSLTAESLYYSIKNLGRSRKMIVVSLMQPWEVLMRQKSVKWLEIIKIICVMANSS